MKPILTALVAIHFAVAAWHGSTHQKLAVLLPPEKNAFVYIVIILLPVVAAALVWTRFAGAGLWIFLASMVASFLFGAYHHYVMVSNDHIHHLPAGSDGDHWAFISSAAALALVELAAALYGAWCLGRRAVTSPS
jgi:hypothetical protein